MKKIFLFIFLTAILIWGGRNLMAEEKIVVLETTQGNIELRPYPDVAPKTCENFVDLAEKGYYDEIIFHQLQK